MNKDAELVAMSTLVSAFVKANKDTELLTMSDLAIAYKAMDVASKKIIASRKLRDRFLAVIFVVAIIAFFLI